MFQVVFLNVLTSLLTFKFKAFIVLMLLLLNQDPITCNGPPLHWYYILPSSLDTSSELYCETCQYRSLIITTAQVSYLHFFPYNNSLENIILLVFYRKINWSTIGYRLSCYNKEIPKYCDLNKVEAYFSLIKHNIVTPKVQDSRWLCLTVIQEPSTFVLLDHCQECYPQLCRKSWLTATQACPSLWEGGRGKLKDRQFLFSGNCR